MDLAERISDSLIKILLPFVSVESDAWALIVELNLFNYSNDNIPMKGAIEILRLRPNELDKFQGLISVFEIAFEMKNFRRPGNLHLQKILAKDGFIAIVALQNNNVVGGLTATSYTYANGFSE